MATKILSPQRRVVYKGTVWVRYHDKTIRKKVNYLFDKVSMNYAMSEMTRIVKSHIKLGTKNIKEIVTIVRINTIDMTPTFFKSVKNFRDISDCKYEYNIESLLEEASKTWQKIM